MGQQGLITKRAEAVDENCRSPVRKNKRPALTLKDLSFNILEQELCRLLSIINLADPLKIVPGDLE